ncbi:MAG: hypothetical protein ACI4T5_09740 [Prevotella sp.]
MIYAVVNTKLAENEGFIRILHRTIGDNMVLNENELSRIDGDIEDAARKLGGVTMSYNELQEYIKKQI